MTIPQIISPKEKWNPVPDYEGLYSVSDRGRVRSHDRRVWDSNGWWRQIHGRVLSPGRLYNGYLLCVFSVDSVRKNYRVHHLVLEAFVGPRPAGMEARHLDGNPQNNQLKNLQWGTKKQNGADKILHGNSCRGEKHNKARLTENNVHEIRRHLNVGRWSQQKIATVFGVARPTISHINRGATWAWLPIEKEK